MTRLWRHLRALWPDWTIVLPLPFFVHAGWAAARGQLHWENVAVLATVVGLFSIGPRSKKAFLGAYPVGLVGLLYDAMKLAQNVGVRPDTVHVCDLREGEIALFGIAMRGERATVHDWLQAHPSSILDAVCAIPYGTFIFVCAGFAAWLYFRDYPRMVRFTWSFLALNVLGFATYHLYPAAPPWYFHAHGCAVDLSAHASEGANLARIDAWLGVRYFAGMYGRSSDVFGAMPSLHVAYPLLVALEGWRVLNAAWRAASVAFFALMCFAAVYLDHHWVIDVVAGTVYCVVVHAAARALSRARSRVAGRQPAHTAAAKIGAR